MAGNEVATQTPRTIKALVQSRRDDFAAIVPRHVPVESFMGLAEAYIRRDENLRTAAAQNPASVMIALRECAALGHVPMKGTFALVPFRSKNAPGGWEVSGIEEVRGTIQRMFRAGGVISVHVALVRENDHFVMGRPGDLPDHTYSPFASEEDRGPLAGVYAWARLRGGGISQVVWMNRSEVMRYRAVAKTTKFWDGPWQPEMWQKTALHRLEKFVPTSPEFLWNLAAAEAGSAGAFPDLPDRPATDPGYDDSIVDAEVVTDPPPAPTGDTDWPDPATPGGGTNA